MFSILSKQDSNVKDSVLTRSSLRSPLGAINMMTSFKLRLPMLSLVSNTEITISMDFHLRRSQSLVVQHCRMGFRDHSVNVKVCSITPRSFRLVASLKPHTVSLSTTPRYESCTLLSKRFQPIRHLLDRSKFATVPVSYTSALSINGPNFLRHRSCPRTRTRDSFTSSTFTPNPAIGRFQSAWCLIARLGSI